MILPRTVRLGIATWVVLMGFLATIPLCAFLYFSYSRDLAQLRVENRMLREREAALAAEAISGRLREIANALRFAATLAEVNGGSIDGAASQLPGVRSVRLLPSTSNAGMPLANGTFLSAFTSDNGERIALVSLPLPAQHALGSYLTLSATVLPDRLAQGVPGMVPGAVLADQSGDGLVPTPSGASRTRGDAAAPGARIAGGWTVTIPEDAESLAARQSELRQRFAVGGTLSFLAGMALLYALARRLRSQIGWVASDFNGSDGEPPTTVISEFADLGGALADARAAVGKRTLELEKAQHDALTGLPGRELLLYRAEAQLHSARGMDDCGVALLYIDLDGFKEVNDAMGHKAGDEILRRVGATLRDCVRAPDAVGRVGGDEFVVCFAAPMKLLEQLAQRTSDRISASVSQLGAGVGCSVGWATSSADCDLLDLIHQADEAMYLNKAMRKNLRGGEPPMQPTAG